MSGRHCRYNCGFQGGNFYGEHCSAGCIDMSIYSHVVCIDLGLVATEDTSGAGKILAAAAVVLLLMYRNG